MLAIRLVKISMVASTALFALLVAFDNLVDYGSNYEFVRHTLSMDTTYPGNALTGTRDHLARPSGTLAYWVDHPGRGGDRHLMLAWRRFASPPTCGPAAPVSTPPRRSS